MTTNFLIVFGGAVLLIMASCNGSEQKNATGDMSNTEEKKDSPNSNVPSPNIPEDVKNILGEWTMVKHFRDDNGNHKIDEGEDKAVLGGTNTIKLNADGTCKYETIMDGTYKITEEDGRKKLTYYDMSGNKYPMELYINSVNKNELVINVNQGGGSQFEIYNRP
jgi:hypothetical protein